MSSEFKIAETDHFVSRISGPRFAKIYRKIVDYVYPLLRVNPFYGNQIKKLKGELSGLYRFRIGDYRLIYTVEKEQILVLILDIKDRQRAYD